MSADIMRHLFAGDTDGSGTLSLDELVEAVKDPQVKPLLSMMGMNETDVYQLFRLLDFDESGQIDPEELLSGCFRLQGNLKTIDFASFLADYWHFMQVFAHQMETLEEVVDHFKNSNGM